MLAPLFQTPEALTFVALVDENPVAGAAGRIIPEHRIFALFGAGTLPAFHFPAAGRSSGRKQRAQCVRMSAYI